MSPTIPSPPPLHHLDSLPTTAEHLVIRLAHCILFICNAPWALRHCSVKHMQLKARRLAGSLTRSFKTAPRVSSLLTTHPLCVTSKRNWTHQVSHSFSTITGNVNCNDSLSDQHGKCSQNLILYHRFIKGASVYESHVQEARKPAVVEESKRGIKTFRDILKNIGCGNLKEELGKVPVLDIR